MPAGSEGGAASVWNALSPCLQADGRKLLEGDLNSVQRIASFAVESYRNHLEAQRYAALSRRIDSIVDLYVQLEHNELWQSVESKRKSARDDDEVKLDELSADTMDEMLEKMRRAAGML